MGSTCYWEGGGSPGWWLQVLVGLEGVFICGWDRWWIFEGGTFQTFTMGVQHFEHFKRTLNRGDVLHGSKYYYYFYCIPGGTADFKSTWFIEGMGWNLRKVGRGIRNGEIALHIQKLLKKWRGVQHLPKMWRRGGHKNSFPPRDTIEWPLLRHATNSSADIAPDLGPSSNEDTNPWYIIIHHRPVTDP